MIQQYCCSGRETDIPGNAKGLYSKIFMKVRRHVLQSRTSHEERNTRNTRAPGIQTWRHPNHMIPAAAAFRVEAKVSSAPMGKGFFPGNEDLSSSEWGS